MHIEQVESQSFLNRVQYIIKGKKSQRCENGAKERQETLTETNMQGEGRELDEKSDFKVSQEYKNDTYFKSQHSKLF